MRRALPVLLLLAGCSDPVATTDAPATGTTIIASTGALPTTGDIPTTTDITTGDPPPLCVPLADPLALQWTRTGAELPGFIARIAATPAGDIVLAGRSDLDPGDEDVFVSVRDPGGAPRWSDTYHGLHGLPDRAIGLALAADGHIHVLVEETVSLVMLEGEGIADHHLVLLRYGPDGQHIWRWELPHAHGEPPIAHEVEGTVAVVDDAILVLEGSFDAPRVVHTLDRFGNLLAETTLVLPPGLDASRIRVTAIAADGTSVLAATDFLPGPDQQTRQWLGRFAADGALLWGTTVGEPEDRPERLALGPAGDIHLVWRDRLEIGKYTFRASRWTPDGALAWTATLPTPSELQLGAAHTHCDGSLVVVGGLAQPPGPDLEWDQRHDLWLAHLAPADGSITTFLHEFGPPYSYGDASEAATAPDGRVTVVASYLGDDGMNYLPWLGQLAQ